MKKYFFMAMAAIAALNSCSRDNEFEQIQAGSQGLVFTATMENSEATRATLDNKRAAWEAGDQISINGKKYSAQGAGTTTTFKADAEGATGETYNAYFPADLYDGTTATLPAIQNYEEGEFNMPMYASSTTTELEFKNLCAVLAIKVTSADIATLKSIKVASDQKMNGKFTVSDKKAVIADENGTNVVVLASFRTLTLTEEGTTFYIAIPAQEYKYLNIFLSADGKTYTQAMATKKAAGLGDITRSNIFNIDYENNATKLWEGDLFIADCNVGATSPEEYGGHYCWGSSYDESEGWKGEYYEEDIQLTGDFDIATKLWGDNWRMPTNYELKTLKDLGSNYTNDYILICNSNDYSGSSVSLPAAGYCDDNGFHLKRNYNNTDWTTGCYWSSTPNNSYDDNAYYLSFYRGSGKLQSDMLFSSRSLAYSVRAVLEEAESPEPPAPATKGKARRTGGYKVEWVQLWENGPKFAVYNVGAENNKPEDFGGYYCWGSSYDESKGWKGEYYNENDDNLPGDYDTATNLWGNNWRMPTIEEFRALKENCSRKDETVGGHTGHRFTGKGNYASNSIFLPNAGDYDNTGLTDEGLSFYWSSTYRDTEKGYLGPFFLTCNSEQIIPGNRDYAFSVRAVLNE